MCVKNFLKNFLMSEQYWGCLDKMSEVNFSPTEILDTPGMDFPTFLKFGPEACAI